MACVGLDLNEASQRESSRDETPNWSVKDMAFSLHEVIEHLINPQIPEIVEETVTICECSLGCLKFNPVTDGSYTPEKGCSVRKVCYYVATEKHLARTSAKHFNRRRRFEEKLARETKVERLKNKKAKKSKKNSHQGTLFAYL